MDRGKRGLNGICVGIAEQPQMNDQRPEPIDRLAALPTRIERERVEEDGRRAIEQSQHGDINLAVAVTAGGIDQRRDAIARDEHVAAPQIAVQQRWPGIVRQQFR